MCQFAFKPLKRFGTKASVLPFLTDASRLSALPAVPRRSCQCCPPSEFVSASSPPPSVCSALRLPITSLFLCVCFTSRPFYSLHLSPLRSPLAHVPNLLLLPLAISPSFSFPLALFCTVMDRPLSRGLSAQLLSLPVFLPDVHTLQTASPLLYRTHWTPIDLNTSAALPVSFSYYSLSASPSHYHLSLPL